MNKDSKFKITNQPSQFQADPNFKFLSYYLSKFQFIICSFGNSSCSAVLSFKFLGLFYLVIYFIFIFILILFSSVFFLPIFSLSARFWRKVCKIHLFQSKVCKEQAKSKKQKQSQELVLCHPRALRMPLCKECKKLFIIIIIHHHHFTLPIHPLPPH